MEINKTYDLEKLHEIVSIAIEDALKTKLFHARIDLISAKEITEILKEEQIREEKRKHIVDDMIKNSTKSFGVLDENMNPVFLEIEHPETEMIEGEIESYILRLADKDRELEELRRHLEHLKETISIKNEQLNNLKRCYSEMKGCYEVCLNCENSRSCVNAVLTKELETKECKEIPDDDCEWLFDDKVKQMRPKCYNKESITEEIAKKCRTCYYSEECRNG